MTAPLRAMLITAGYGTRLAPLTDQLPKPAVPIANKPLAWFAMDHLYRCGVREIVANTHHLAHELRTALEPHVPSDLHLRFVHEAEILGTGGGLRNAWQPQDGETFLAINGKVLFAPDIDAALELHQSSGAIATMVLKPMLPGDTFGAVEIDDTGRVRRLLGAPAEVSATLTRTMYTGLSLLSARAHRDLPHSGCLIRDAYRHWLDRGEIVMGILDPSPFRDAGITPKHYLETNLALLQGQEHWPDITPDPNGVLLAPGVTQSPNTILQHCAIAEGATLADGIRLTRCIVWPNTPVTRSAQDTIFTPQAEVTIT
jgi:mannose-1-phosphate guanylyltransferase